MDRSFIVNLLVGWASLTIGVLILYQATDRFTSYKELLTNKGFKLLCAGLVAVMGGVMFLLLLFKG